MGHKKRASASHRKSETPPSQPPPSAAELMPEFKRAFFALSRGNHSKAVRIIKESTPKFENSALFHRVAGYIHVRVASLFDDPTVKNRHLNQALESGKKASELSANSLEYALFYASLWLELSKESSEYDAVAAECERALAIENPNDPALDDFVREENLSLSVEAKRARILGYQSELRTIAYRANVASLSFQVKNLDFDDEFTLVPVRHNVAEGLVEAWKRSRGIQKSSETVEENGDGSGGWNGEMRRRDDEARRSDDLSDQVRSFWNSMSLEMKRSLLSIKVSDLRAYLYSLSDEDGGQAVKVFSEALVLAEKTHTWKILACFRCGEAFGDANDRIYHGHHEHWGNLIPKLQSAVPRSVDSEWKEMLVTCSWDPLDLTASIRMLEDQSKSKVSDACWNDGVVEEMRKLSFQEKKKTVEGICNGKVDCRVYNHISWPVSDDTERAKLLRIIRSLFHALLRHKCLAKSHLHDVLYYTIGELQRRCPGSQILSRRVGQTPLCICFLGASSLEKIVDFLQYVSCHAGYGKYPEEVSVGDTGCCSQDLDCEDVFKLDESASFLLLDETLLQRDAARDDMGSGSSVGRFGKGAKSDPDLLLSWIYNDSYSPEQLATWLRIKQGRSQECVQLLETLDKEITQLLSLCDKKHELLGQEQILHRMTEIHLAAESVHISQYGYEHAYGTISSGKAEEDGKSYLQITLQEKKEQLTSDLSKVDAEMMRKMDDVNQLELKLQPLSVIDYRFVLLPLLKSFMQAHLEDLAEKDATENYDAAKEAFLAELGSISD